MGDGELVVHTKNTAPESQKLSTTDHSYHMDGWLLGARLCICPGIFPELKSVQTLKKKKKKKIVGRDHGHPKQKSTYTH